MLFLSANSKISHINSRNKCVKNFNTNWNGTPCKQRKYAVLFPHAWECSCTFFTSSGHSTPFPTCVGVFPNDIKWNARWITFSHMRGSVPLISWWYIFFIFLFPHAWEYSFAICKGRLFPRKWECSLYWGHISLRHFSQNQTRFFLWKIKNISYLVFERDSLVESLFCYKSKTLSY